MARVASVGAVAIDNISIKQMWNICPVLSLLEAVVSVCLSITLLSQA